MSLLFISLITHAQEVVDEQYPVEPIYTEGDFVPERGLPQSDYEEVPREEQEYIPEHDVTDEIPPEELYEEAEEYVE